jgi:hypothetical protein
MSAIAATISGGGVSPRDNEAIDADGDGVADW